jgi:hypothetical protein
MRQLMHCRETWLAPLVVGSRLAASNRAVLYMWFTRTDTHTHTHTRTHPRHNLMSKLVPQPQLLVAPGMPVILNWLPINSMV